MKKIISTASICGECSSKDYNYLDMQITNQRDVIKWMNSKIEDLRREIESLQNRMAAIEYYIR